MSVPTCDPAAISFVLLDLDGVVWLARQEIAGAARAIERIRASGRRVIFVTNNAMSPVAEVEAALAAIGVPAVGDVITSAQAGASLLEPGEVVHACAGPGVVEAASARGVELTEGEVADAVIVGLHHTFNYEGLRAASRAIRNGARFVATNDDATFPTPDGPTPGAGSLIAAVATASGVEPEIAGKPYEPMAQLVRERCGAAFTPRAALMVGDRWSTDARFAETLGCPFALVRTGVTGPSDTPEGVPAIDAPDLAGVAAALLDP